MAAATTARAGAMAQPPLAPLRHMERMVIPGPAAITTNTAAMYARNIPIRDTISSDDSEGGLPPPSTLLLGGIEDVAVLVDGNVDLHADEVGGIAEPCAGERNGLAGMPGIRDRNEIEAGADGVGRVVVAPAGTGKEYLQPRMGRARTGHPGGAAIERTVVQVTADEAGGESQPAQCLYHQPGEVPACAGTRAQGLARRLGAFAIHCTGGELHTEGLKHL